MSTFEERLTTYKNSKRLSSECEAQLLNTTTTYIVTNDFKKILDDFTLLLGTQSAQCAEGMRQLEGSAVMPSPLAWSRKMLRKSCHLLIDDGQLEVSAQQVQEDNLEEVVKLSATLNGLKTRDYVSTKQVRFLEQIEEEFRSVHFAKKDLRRISTALSLKLSEEIENQTVTQEITKHSLAVNHLIPELENCEHLLEAAFQNGDIELAESIADNQIALLEKLLQVTEEQYPLLKRKKEQAQEFLRRRRWAIFRMANSDINGVVESKNRQLEALEEDALNLRNFLNEKKGKDLSSRGLFKSAMMESDAFLEGTAQQQEEAMEKMRRLLEEVRSTEEKLGNLGRTRAAEIKRRTSLIDDEAERVGEHSLLLRVADNYFSGLHKAMKRAERVRDIGKALNDFLLDGCDNITLKFEKSEATMNRIMADVNQQYLRLFSQYAICVGRHQYRKKMRHRQKNDLREEKQMLLEHAADLFDPIGKRYADQRNEFQEECLSLRKEVDVLEKKLQVRSAKFEPCAEMLKESGVPFVHPLDLKDEMNYDRNMRILDYRNIMNVNEDKIEQQIAKDLKNVHQEMTEHKMYLMDKEAATHRRHVDQQCAIKGPRKPQSQTERYQAASFSRFTKLVQQLQGETAAETKVENPKFVHGARPSTAPSRAATSKKLPPRLEGKSVRAIYSYKQRSPDELSFSKGDIIICVHEGPEAGWYAGVCNQRSGLFPLNYVTSCVEDSILEE